jgi:inhibitor of KinA
MQVPSAANPKFSVYYLSERAVTLEFGHSIDRALLQQITTFNRAITDNPFPGFLSSVPAYNTLTLFYDPVLVLRSTQLPGRSGFEKVSAYVNQLRIEESCATIADDLIVTIPVCYGGRFGPDLADVAELHKITSAEVIRLHTSSTYLVYMIGFIPGFAYLGGLDDQLNTPRRATPRPAVAAGAVGIAGAQTGVYPLVTPGGWQIIGQAPLKMFDANRLQPSLLKTGDRVVFKAVDEIEFGKIAKDAGSHS